ncbi:hypothetical protein [Candidatus Methylomirabilis sp.]|uniref:hypothetical protein n=1 Tax=Candidatus Methylomirabilis sp. TaxID=2032687 RepID=UPI003C78CEB5
MRRIRGWSTCRCLFLAFGGGLIPFVALANIGMVASRIVRQGLSAIQEETALGLERIANLKLSWDQLVLVMKDCMVTGGLKERMQVDRHTAHFEAAFRSLATIPSHQHEGENRQLIEMLRGIVSDIEARSQEVLAIPNPLKNRDVLAMMGKR